MQVNNVVHSEIIQHLQNFKGSSAENNTDLDNFRNDKSTKTTEDHSSNFFVKLITHPSLIVVPLLPVACYDIYSSIKESSLEKSSLPEETINKINKNLIKTTLAFFLTSIPLYLATDYINQKYKDKNFIKAKKQVYDFNKLNKTDIKLVVSPIDKKNITILGGFNSNTGQMLLPEKISGDIFNSVFRQKYIIKHELVHAQQYILMACSKNGINKMNYIAVKRASEKLSDKQKIKIKDIYKEINNNENCKYKNKTKKINDYEINYVDYFTALYKVLYDKNANPDNIPIIINKEFYENAKSTREPLTEEEENKAQLYLEAYEKYPVKVGYFQSINPFSDYRQNLLEKEAYGF